MTIPKVALSEEKVREAISAQDPTALSDLVQEIAKKAWLQGYRHAVGGEIVFEYENPYLSQEQSDMARKKSYR